jgi:hypothetical protein
MKPTDLSKEIFDKYFGVASSLVVITLHDKTELTGKLTGFFRGDEEFNEPYIIMWRFVNENELKEIDFLPYPNQEVGCLIRQKDIATVRLK